MTGGFIYTRTERNKGADFSVIYKHNNPSIHLERKNFLKIPIWFRSLEEVFLTIKKVDGANTIPIGQD